MKFRFLMAVWALIAGCTAAMGQDRAVAILEHGDSSTAYYGSDALKSAMETAVKGDIIYLSAGVFATPDISKSVKIIGCGYINDHDNSRYSTQLTGNFAISTPKGEEGLTIEGIRHDGDITGNGNMEGVTFRCCKLNNVTLQDTSFQCRFERCRIGGKLDPDDHSVGLYIKNSIINSIAANSSDATLLIENCICSENYSLKAATIRNSIITYYVSTDNGIIWDHVIYCSSYGNISGQAQQTDVTPLTVTEMKDVFRKGSALFKADDDWHLTEAAVSAYKGTDGTQIGIFGGAHPFTDVPSNPQVTSRSIASETDAYNKLSVKVTVEAQPKE